MDGNFGDIGIQCVELRSYDAIYDDRVADIPRVGIDYSQRSVR
jgi:hypothetical protein